MLRKKSALLLEPPVVKISISPKPAGAPAEKLRILKPCPVPFKPEQGAPGLEKRAILVLLVKMLMGKLAEFPKFVPKAPLFKELESQFWL